MRSRTLLALAFASAVALPLAAHAAIPFFGPIIPPPNISGVPGSDVCAAGWGMLITVINNIISLLITLAIVFVAPLMIAWSGFLFVVNPVKPSGKEQARKILTNTIVGIVIALAGYLIVAAIMAVLYHPSEASGWQTWSDLVTGDSSNLCIPQVGSTVAPTPPPVITVPAVPGRFTFDPGINAQVPTESGPLAALLSCMVTKVPAGVGRISSISDSQITSGQKTFTQCAAGGCQHTANSCHYGGRSCVGSSYAVDFGDDQNMSVLTAAAQACGAQTLNEGTHLHASVGAANGCGCGI